MCCDTKIGKKKGLQVIGISCKPFVLQWRRHPDSNRRITVLQTAALTTWLCRPKTGAGNGARTRDPNLGKVVLYQLSYSRYRYIIKPYSFVNTVSQASATVLIS